MRNNKMGSSIVLLTALLTIGFVFANGCKKQSSPPLPAATAAAETEQKICPVMGAPINKNLFTEYQGKKVYFCCPDCKAEFEKNPEKYLAKLPQFKK